MARVSHATERHCRRPPGNGIRYCCSGIDAEGVGDLVLVQRVVRALGQDHELLRRAGRTARSCRGARTSRRRSRRAPCPGGRPASRARGGIPSTCRRPPCGRGRSARCPRSSASAGAGDARSPQPAHREVERDRQHDRQRRGRPGASAQRSWPAAGIGARRRAAHPSGPGRGRVGASHRYATWPASNRSRRMRRPVSTFTTPLSMVIGNRSSARGAGGERTSPRMSNTEAWQGQGNDRSFSFHGTVQPRCEHVDDSARKPPSASRTR